MAAPTTAKKPSEKPRRRRRYIIPIIIGVILGALCVLFMRKIYNPFAPGLDDRSLLVLVPDDADLVLSVPHVPKFLGELRDREFSKHLVGSDHFQEFLRSPYATRKGATRAVSAAFAALDRLRAGRPLGLELWGEISGEELAVVGYAPMKKDDPWQALVMFRPGSWKVLAAINALIDDDIGGLDLVKSEMERQGITVQERFRDSITLKVDRATLVSIARVRDVVLFGTDVGRLQRLKASIERDGVPDHPRPRYSLLEAEAATSQRELRALVRRAVADSQLELTQTLNDQWGPDNLHLAQSIVPRFGGEDLVVKLALDDTLELSVRTIEGAAFPTDLSQFFKPFPRDIAVDVLRRTSPLLPPSTFSFGHFEVEDLRHFLDNLFKRPEVFSAAEMANVKDGLASMPEVKDLAGLIDAIDASCHGSFSLALFTQERDERVDKPDAGFAAVFELKDEARLRQLITAIGDRVRLGGTPGEKNALRDLVASKQGDIDLFELVLPDGFIDDRRVNKPGFAITRGQLIFTNFFPMLRNALKRRDGQLPSAANNDILSRTLANTLEELHLSWAMSGGELYGYFDQAADAWAIKRTTASAAEERVWRLRAERDAQQHGLTPGTPEFTRYADESFNRDHDALAATRRAVRAEIQQYLDYFRGLVDSAGLSVRGTNGLDSALGLEIKLRLELAR